MGNDVSSSTSKDTKLKKEKALPTCKIGQKSTITDSKNVSEYKDEKKLKQENKKIQDVLLKLERLRKTVEEFDGARQDEQFRYLVESLLKCQVDLDDVDSQDVENIKIKRRNAHLVIQKALDELYDKTEWN